MASFTRAELESFRDAEVPDLLGPDLRLLFVGINPGLWTAATQTHFAHPANRFYPALLRAGVISAADLTVRRDDRRRPRPPAVARHRDHQPGPPGLRPGRRAQRRGAASRRARAGGAGRPGVAAGGRGRRHHGVPDGVRSAQGGARPSARAARRRRAVGGAEPQRPQRPRNGHARRGVREVADGCRSTPRVAGAGWIRVPRA